jgi:two-component system sensor histidine kinase/response regulator
MDNFSILYVDDEESNLKGFKSIYFTDYTIYTAISGKEALDILANHEVHIIITDQKMPGMTGVEFLSNTMIKYPDPIRIILTGYSDIEVLMKAINECGIFRYLTKPWNETEMNLTINQALDTYRLRKENNELISKLTVANTTLEEKVKERTERIENLISAVAHDLRSPLNQVQAIISLIQIDSANLTQGQTSLIDLVVQASSRLKKMINRILDLNAIEHKDVILKLERADLNKIIRDVTTQARALCAEKALKISTQSQNGEYFATADVNYLIQVIENLLSNAIKYSPHNKNIFIETSLVNNKVRLVVRDEGPGLTEEDMNMIFQKFRQLSAKPSAGEESSGLGLYLAKRYVESMNGQIWCESKPGQGASFIIELTKG